MRSSIGRRVSGFTESHSGTAVERAMNNPSSYRCLTRETTGSGIRRSGSHFSHVREEESAVFPQSRRQQPLRSRSSGEIDEVVIHRSPILASLHIRHLSACGTLLRLAITCACLSFSSSSFSPSSPSSIPSCRRYTGPCTDLLYIENKT